MGSRGTSNLISRKICQSRRATPPTEIGEHRNKAVRAVANHKRSLSGVTDVVKFARDLNSAKPRGG